MGEKISPWQSSWEMVVWHQSALFMVNNILGGFRISEKWLGLVECNAEPGWKKNAKLNSWCLALTDVVECCSHFGHSRSEIRVDRNGWIANFDLLFVWFSLGAGYHCSPYSREDTLWPSWVALLLVRLAVVISAIGQPGALYPCWTFE